MSKTQYKPEELTRGCIDGVNAFKSMIDSTKSAYESELERTAVAGWLLRNKLRSASEYERAKIEADIAACDLTCHRTLEALNAIANIKGMIGTWDGYTLRDMILRKADEKIEAKTE